MRNLKLIGLLILIGIYSSCSINDNNLTLTGTYTESIPFPGTHQLDFVDNNTLILKARNSTDEEFIYELSDNIIKLNPTRDLSKTWELEINVLNNSKFEITNIFYPSIPEDDDAIQFVTFEK
ncbi:MAG TPA: hypothetical protein VGA80_07920 [Flavobacteriaceae bacterium]|jgi:hypothetical protein